MSLRSSVTRLLTRPLGRRAAVPRGRRVSYRPRRDGSADPGEVVWTRVAFEDRPQESKDRPVLIVGFKGRGTVLGLMLSTQESRAGQDGWLPLGTGPWDARGRKSYVRLDRVLEIDAKSIRREGAVLDQARFQDIAASLRARHGWS
ncbi:MAG: hypothetical protein JWN88_306 [Frankiales bacterium]|nr:hypothetical protein [Frankiales bacterium]